MKNISIYYSSILDPVSEEVFAYYMNCFSAPVRKRIAGFHHRKDAEASLIGKCLLLEFCKDENILPALPLELNHSRWGKPSIPGNIHFNISHSGNYVVCAVSADGPVGIDIELIQTLPLEDFKPFFEDREWNEMDGDTKSFYRTWVKKEAASKANGRGLDIPLNTIRIEGNKAMIENESWWLSPVSIDENYTAFLACKYPEINLSYIEIDFNERKPYTQSTGYLV